MLAFLLEDGCLYAVGLLGEITVRRVRVHRSAVHMCIGFKAWQVRHDSFDLHWVNPCRLSSS